MIECRDFLAEYSSLRDRAGASERIAALEAHLASCLSCARYHRVVQRGIAVACAMQPLEVSDDFGARLQHRIFHVDEEMASGRRFGSTRSVLGTTAIAAAIAGIAWSPVVRRSPLLNLPGITAAPPAAVATNAPLAGEPARVRHLASQLADLGVPVVDTPYRDLMFAESPLTARLAVYAVEMDTRP